MLKCLTTRVTKDGFTSSSPKWRDNVVWIKHCIEKFVSKLHTSLKEQTRQILHSTRTDGKTLKSRIFVSMATQLYQDTIKTQNTSQMSELSRFEQTHRMINDQTGANIEKKKSILFVRIVSTNGTFTWYKTYWINVKCLNNAQLISVQHVDSTWDLLGIRRVCLDSQHDLLRSKLRGPKVGVFRKYIHL